MLTVCIIIILNLTKPCLSCIIYYVNMNCEAAGRVVHLSGKKKVYKVQEALSQFVGSDVKLKANSGRRKFIERSGVLEGTYANLFVVRVADQSVERKMSFSYVDLLTGNVVLIVNRDGKDYRLVVNQN